MQTFCLSAPDRVVHIPLLFNNSRPSSLQYSISSFEDDGAKTFVDLSAKDLKHIEKAQADSLRLTFQRKADLDYNEDDEDDDHPSHSDFPRDSTGLRLQKTETLHHLKITRPGIVRLERAVEGDIEIRIRPSEVTIVECPTARFVGDVLDHAVRCIGTTEGLQMRLTGVAPLSLKWTREVRSRRVQSIVEGIEGSHEVRPQLLLIRS